jgi:two-component system, chemotaxis family, protein-glutamate methylesterase/glutaminase
MDSVRVLVVDDSAFMRTALRRMIESDPTLHVIDTASDGLEGVQKAAALRPDVITMDVEMPRMSGLDALSKIMEIAPCPVIMVSSLTRSHAEATIEALSRGAYDFLSKDLSYASLDIVRIKEDLVAKCKAAAHHKRSVRFHPRLPNMHSAAGAVHPPLSAPLCMPTRTVQRTARLFPVPTVICLGTSTGGPKALQQILPMLPANLPAPLVIVQHMPPGFTGPFARRLDSLCQLRVKESEPDEQLLPGFVYIARAGEQLRVRRRGAGVFAHMSMVPTNTPHIPSVDTLMLSAADQFGPYTMGIILTGMGCDGQHGIAAIYRVGGCTVGEDESTCTVYGMPRACAEAGILHSVLPLDAIPSEIIHVAGTIPLAVNFEATHL